MSHEPLVTGLGCVSPFGRGVKTLWARLVGGESAIRPICSFATEDLLNAHGAEIELDDFMCDFAHRRRISSRIELFAVLAIEEALSDAAIAAPDLQRQRVALVLGTSLGMSLVTPDLGGTLSDCDSDPRYGTDLGTLGSMLSSHCGFRGQVTVISTACASGAHAIGLARDMILADEFDVVVAGGVDTLDRMKYLGHTALSTLTTDVPRPFSRLRGGTLFGEGGAFLVLQKAAQKAPRIYAECRGAGFSTDTYHLTAPDPDGDGAARAIEMSLRDARLKASEVDHLNLHGTGTLLNDAAEVRALNRVFGERSRSIPCTAIKAAIGHTLGAAGALEALVTVQSVYRGMIPPTLNVSKEDLDCDLNLVMGSAAETPIRHAISNSFGFGGSNGALLFSRVGQ